MNSESQHEDPRVVRQPSQPRNVRTPKSASILEELTVEEKASLTSGASFWETQPIERLGVPSIFVADGPHGLRKQGSKGDHLGLMGSIPATSFPTAATLANSWDDRLLHQVGEAIASEAIEQGVDVVLGPGLNIKRSPLAGRNFEYFSEDPLLAGKLAAAFIRGAQSLGVGACPKHFAVNSQETYRTAVDEVVDERALHEIYLEGFRIAVEEGSPWMMMSSYNQVNGQFAHQNPYLISEVLRDRWGFDGVVVSDWGGNVDSAAALNAGSNLEMPGSGGVGERRVLAALESGDLNEEVLDDRIGEFLTLTERVGAPKAKRAPLDFDQQHEIARRAAEESIVLLQNDNDALPLSAGERVAVVGPFADVPRYQGAGSSLVNPTKITSALEALKETDLNIVGYEPGFKRADTPSKRLAEKALDLAAQADTVLLFLGLDEGAESEGIDRNHMKLARNQLALTRQLVEQARAQTKATKIIVLLAGGAPVELPFADHVDAIVHAYLSGQAGGSATANILTGEVNPSGRLAESYPERYEDVASSEDFAQNQASAEHRESIYVGYRHFDKAGLAVRYPFGFGLSYTDFEFSNVTVPKSAVPTHLEVDVTNTGDVDGDEVVQVYVHPLGSEDLFREDQVLAGYTKVHVPAGETRRVRVDLAEHAFSVYDVKVQDWVCVSGQYQLRVASSSRDFQEIVEVRIEGDVAVDEVWALHQDLPTYASGEVSAVPDEEFEELLGYAPPAASWDPSEPLDRDSLFAQMPGHSTLANLAHGAIVGTANTLDRVGKPIAGNYARLALAFPLRSLEVMSDGAINEKTLNKIIAFLNGEGLKWQREKK